MTASALAEEGPHRYESESTWTRRGVLGVLAFGVAIRLAHLLGGRSVHIDEARLALNIGQRSFVELLRPLSYEQSAPIPFLWLEKLATQIGGVNEVSLRFLPFLSGIALLLVVVQLARRLLPPLGIVLYSALAGVSPVLVHYSNEIKPYMIDALLGAALTVSAIDLVEQNSQRLWLRFLCLGTIAILVSTPAILVLLGLTAVLAAHGVRSKRWYTRRLVPTATIWIGVFLVLYVLFYRAMSSHPYMRHFWEPAFLGSDVATVLPRLRGMTSEIVWGSLMGGYVHGVREPHVMLASNLANGGVLIMAIAGVAHLARTRGATMAALLLSPVIVTLLASLVNAYPISLRLVLYWVPILLLVVTAGICFTVRNAKGPLRLVLIVILAAATLIRPALRVTIPQFWPYHRQELRPLVDVLESRSAGEAVYVFANAVPAWLFYTTDWSMPDTARLNWYSNLAGADGPAFENAAPRDRPVIGEGAGMVYTYRGRREIVGVSTGEQWRVIVGSRYRRPDEGWVENEAGRIDAEVDDKVWLVFSHFRGSENGLLDELERRGFRQVFNKEATGAHLFEYARSWE